jgi:hypothetical protein
MVAMKAKHRITAISTTVICLGLAAMLVGLNCGSDKSTEATGYGEVRLVVAAGEWEDGVLLGLGAAPVPVEDIESFLLTVDRISLNVSAEDDTAEAEEDSTGIIIVFDASEQPAVDNEIDLVDLENLSDILSSAEVPAGDYGQIRMEISDPRLRLVGDAVGEYRTNVSLTANGRLFANVDLVISPGETTYLRLVLDRIHLVETGGGDFVLTPQLRVEVLSEL